MMPRRSAPYRTRVGSSSKRSRHGADQRSRTVADQRGTAARTTRASSFQGLHGRPLGRWPCGGRPRRDGGPASWSRRERDGKPANHPCRGIRRRLLGGCWLRSRARPVVVGLFTGCKCCWMPIGDSSISSVAAFAYISWLTHCSCLLSYFPSLSRWRSTPSLSRCGTTSRTGPTGSAGRASAAASPESMRW